MVGDGLFCPRSCICLGFGSYQVHSSSHNNVIVSSLLGWFLLDLFYECNNVLAVVSH